MDFRDTPELQNKIFSIYRQTIMISKTILSDVLDMKETELIKQKFSACIMIEYNALLYFITLKAFGDSGNTSNVLEKLTSVFDSYSQYSSHAVLLDSEDNALIELLGKRIKDYTEILTNDIIPVGSFLLNDYDQSCDLLRLWSAFGDLSLHWTVNPKPASLQDIMSLTIYPIDDMIFYTNLFSRLRIEILKYYNIIYSLTKQIKQDEPTNVRTLSINEGFVNKEIKVTNNTSEKNLVPESHINKKLILLCISILCFAIVCQVISNHIIREKKKAYSAGYSAAMSELDTYKKRIEKEKKLMQRYSQITKAKLKVWNLRLTIGMILYCVLTLHLANIMN